VKKYKEKVEILNGTLESLEKDGLSPTFESTYKLMWDAKKCGEKIALSNNQFTATFKNHGSVMGKFPLQHDQSFSVVATLGDYAFATIGVAKKDAQLNTQTGVGDNNVFAFQVSHNTVRSPSPLPGSGLQSCTLKKGKFTLKVHVNRKDHVATLYVDGKLVGHFSKIPEDEELFPIVGNYCISGKGIDEVTALN